MFFSFCLSPFESPSNFNHNKNCELNLNRVWEFILLWSCVKSLYKKNKLNNLLK